MAKPAHHQPPPKPSAPKAPIHHLQSITDLERDALLQFVPGALQLPKGITAADNLYDGYVIGTAALGPGWASRKKKFTSQADAEAFLRDHGMGGQQVCYIDPIMNNMQLTLENTLENLAAKLQSGAAWCVPIFPQPFQNPGLGKNLTQQLILTSAAVTAQLNKDSNTSIDYDFISRNEGGQWQRGYIPYGYFKKLKLSKVIGASGVTIGSGFDLGQQTIAELKTAKLPQKFIDLFTPYIHHPLTGDGHTAACRYILATGPMPVLDHKDDADELDRFSYLKMLTAVQAAWSRAQQAVNPILPTPGQPPAPKLKDFTALSGAWQTVLLDYAYQHGAGGLSSSKFGSLAMRGDATGAKAALRATTHATAANPDRPYLQWEKLDADQSSLTDAQAQAAPPHQAPPHAPPAPHQPPPKLP